MFPDHNPYPTLFSWLCSTNNIPREKHPDAAAAMRRYVTSAREAFYSPLGRQMPYDDGYFRGAYLLAYFPYYIEPIYHALQNEKSLFAAELAARLHHEGITRRLGTPRSTAIRPRFSIPTMLLENLFTGHDWLIPKRRVKFHHMKLWIQR